MNDSPFDVLGALYEAPQQPQSFEDWLKTAKPGSKYIYATRHALDIHTPPEILAVALEARQAYAHGEVELIQKRTKKAGPFQYIAVKKRENYVPKVNGLPWRADLHKSNKPAESYRSRDWIWG